MTRGKRLCVIGECMLEVSAQSMDSSKVSADLSYGGDTLNTSVYYARMGGQVDYLTALGDDAVSDWMLDCWREEGIGCDWVARYEAMSPGLYMIQLDDHGERSFSYWRQQSAARALLQDDVRFSKLLQEATQGCEMLYLSGITLAVMSAGSHKKLFEFARTFRANGGRVAFDSNHRPKLWPDAESASRVYKEMYANTDIALSTADDEELLFHQQTAVDIVDRLQSWGVQEIVVKEGDEGCRLYLEGELIKVRGRTVKVVDTTAAGDSFNAAYLLSRSVGMNALTAVGNGHSLASTVVSHRGAIIERAQMPDQNSLGFRSSQ